MALAAAALLLLLPSWASATTPAPLGHSSDLLGITLVPTGRSLDTPAPLGYSRDILGDPPVNPSHSSDTPEKIPLVVPVRDAAPEDAGITPEPLGDSSDPTEITSVPLGHSSDIPGETPTHPSHSSNTPKDTHEKRAKSLESDLDTLQSQHNPVSSGKSPNISEDNPVLPAKSPDILEHITASSAEPFEWLRTDPSPTSTSDGIIPLEAIPSEKNTTEATDLPEDRSSTTQDPTTAAETSAGGCPASCWCSAVEAEARCQLPAAALALRADADRLYLACDEGTEFTCEELPQLSLARGQSVAVELQYCRPPRVACVSQRLGAGAVAALYLKNLPEGAALDPAAFHDLPHLQRLAIYGFGSKENMSFPREIVSKLPALQRLTINQASLEVAAGDLDAAPGLVYLELSNARLQRIPPGLFRNLTHLETLNLWRNNLQELTAEQLEGLASVRRLDVSSNALRELGGVTSLRRLRTLAASFNRLRLLPPLATLPLLEELEIIENSEPLSLSPGALSSLPNLKSVKISGCKISSLPADLLHNSSSLQILKLSRNRISSLPEGLWRDLGRLRELDLSGNRLTQLQPFGFQQLRRLETLDIGSNLIEELPSNMLWGLSSLRALRGRGCGARGAAGGALAGAAALQTLDLSHNNLSSLAPHDQQSEGEYSVLESALSRLQQLREVDLSHNRLRAPPPDLPRTAVYLRRLDLSYNLITELTSADISFISDVAVVDYRHNRIARVTDLDWGIEGANGGANGAAESRPSVLLDDNPFDCDCSLYPFVRRLHGYRALDTSEGAISAAGAACAAPPDLRGRPLARLALGALVCRQLPPAACPPPCACLYRAHTHALELTCARPPPPPATAALRHPRLALRLTAPPPAPLALPFPVDVLNLTGLGLREAPPPPPARLVDLTDNALVEVPTYANVSVRAAGNPLACDCAHEAALGALRRLAAADGARVDFERLRCADGARLADAAAGARCGARAAAAAGGALALLGLAAAAAALLLARYSREVRVWLHARGWWRGAAALDDAERKYDAFVSYCHADEEWVRTQLLPGLEAGPARYALCVHARDWAPGEWIPAQIARSVADSRRTIVVLSRAFLDSVWGRAEFRTANMAAVRERRSRVIVVLLDDVTSHPELDAELRAYLSTNTYLRWGEPRFWHRLRYALPHKPAGGGGGGGKEGPRAAGGGELLPAALPRGGPALGGLKCERFDVDIGALRGLHVDQLKEIHTVEH